MMVNMHGSTYEKRLRWIEGLNENQEITGRGEGVVRLRALCFRRMDSDNY